MDLSRAVLALNFAAEKFSGMAEDQECLIFPKFFHSNQWSLQGFVSEGAGLSNKRKLRILTLRCFQSKMKNIIFVFIKTRMNIVEFGIKIIVTEDENFNKR